MKYAFILLVAFLTNAVAKADCNTQNSEAQATEQLVIQTDVPKHLVGATICVKQADGRESCVPAEKFKVVPRKQQFIVTKTKESSVTTCSVDQARLKNRVSLLGGEGPKKNIEVTREGDTVTLESKSGAVGGVQYQRELTRRINVGAELLSNQTGLVSIGLDF